MLWQSGWARSALVAHQVSISAQSVAADVARHAANCASVQGKVTVPTEGLTEGVADREGEEVAAPDQTLGTSNRGSSTNLIVIPGGLRSLNLNLSPRLGQHLGPNRDLSLQRFSLVQSFLHHGPTRSTKRMTFPHRRRTLASALRQK